MATNLKNTRANPVEKTTRENAKLSADYEVQAKITREKTARLKALRLARRQGRGKRRQSKPSSLAKYG